MLFPPNCRTKPGQRRRGIREAPREESTPRPAAVTITARAADTVSEVEEEPNMERDA